MTEQGEAAAAKTELERAAREYALVVRRVRSARAADAAGRRGHAADVLGAHARMFRAAMGYRSPPGRIAPETELERAAAAMARDARRVDFGPLQSGTEQGAQEFLKRLHDAAMAAYDPQPAAADGRARERHGPDETIALRRTPPAGGQDAEERDTDGRPVMYRGVPLSGDRRPGRCEACGSAEGLSLWLALFTDGRAERIRLCADCAPDERLTPGDGAADRAAAGGRVPAAETDLERTARKYAAAMRRARSARGARSSRRRKLLAAVREAHSAMALAALDYRAPPGRVPPETALRAAAGECVRAMARETAGEPHPDGELGLGDAFEVLHLSAMAAYDPDPDAPPAPRPGPPAAGSMEKFDEMIAWAREMQERTPDRDMTEEEEAAFFVALRHRWREAMADLGLAGDVLRHRPPGKEERQ